MTSSLTLLLAAALPRLTLSWKVVIACYAVSILLSGATVVHVILRPPPPMPDMDEDAHEAIVARQRATAAECARWDGDDAA